MELEQADSILQRVGILAMMYYPDIHTDDPGFDLATEVDWCLAETTSDVETFEQLRGLISGTILDPSAHRQQLTARVYGLVPDTAN